MEKETLIELKSVNFSYPRSTEPVLRNINLKINRGDFIGIIGGNRAGKSTLLHILSGVIPHYASGKLEGEVTFYGENTHSLSLSKIGTHVGVVLQDPDAQLFNMYVKQELLWGLENRGFPPEEMDRRVNASLPFFGLENILNHFCAGISGGQKQKVAIAAVYLTQPNVLLVDNPTSMLDPVSTGVVLDTIKKLVDRNQTIVMVEENIFELLHRANRLILLDNGQIRLDAPPSEYRHQIPRLREAGVYVPQIWELIYLLEEKGLFVDTFPLTLNEAEVVFKDLLSDAKKITS